MKNIFCNLACENKNENNTYIFIDGSYYCFYRYYSLLNWWKLAFPEIPLYNPIENETFVDKYKKTFIENIQNLQKNLKINKNINPIFIVGKDCKRENIWRLELFKDYKANRDKGNDDLFKGGPFFQLTYEEKLFEQAGITKILKHRHLEADDCIALYVKKLLKNQDNCNIYIITSDKDYLQLVEPRVKLYNLSFKNLAEQKSSFGCPQKDLFCKILTGDTSDNIPSVLKKCGPKTALKCFSDKEYFVDRLSVEHANDKFQLNQKLIDFNYIPENLVTEFYESINLYE
jgi:5'-3' exonuclease